MPFRSGLGFDIHKLEEGKSFPLAGVPIEGRKVIAHSDGDCLLHALSNAILSALGKEDIGTYFPDNKAETLGRDSSNILLFALGERKKEGWKLSNVSATVILQKPKLLPYKKQRKENLSRLLGLEESGISVRANTREGIGEIGKGNAVVCLVSLIREK